MKVGVGAWMKLGAKLGMTWRGRNGVRGDHDLSIGGLVLLSRHPAVVLVLSALLFFFSQRLRALWLFVRLRR